MYLQIFIWFLVFCFQFNVLKWFRGNGDEDIFYALPVASKHLFVGNSMDIKICGIKIVNNTNFPEEMMISITIDKTLGYRFDPFFPFFVDKEPDVLHLNATDVNQTSTQSLSTTTTTFIFKIDFTTASLIEISPSQSSMVHLHPNRSSISSNNGNASNKTEYAIEITSNSTQADGEFILYDLHFVVSIDTADSEGLYKVFFYPNKEIFIGLAEVSFLPWYNASMIWLIVEVTAFVMMILLTFAFFRYLKYDKTSEITVESLRICRLESFRIFFFKLAGALLLLLADWLLPNFEQQFLVSDMKERLPLGKLSTYLVMCVEIDMSIVLMYRIISNRELVRLKFHLFSWLILTYVVVQAYEKSFVAVWRTLSDSFVLFLNQKNLYDLESILHDWKMDETNKKAYNSISSRVFVNKCLHVIYASIVVFQLILVSMIALDVPFHLFWVEFAVDGSLYVLFFCFGEQLLISILYSAKTDFIFSYLN